MKLTKSCLLVAGLLIGLGGCASSDGLDGRTSLTRIDDEPAGPNCKEGGVLIRTGLDENSDGVLQGGEVGSESLLCNGIDGDDGPAYVTATATEPIGANCSNGGVRVTAGPDTNANGELDADEVVATEYVCNGTDGTDGPEGPAGPTGPAGADGTDGSDGADGADALVDIVAEAAGGNCADGGIRVTSGPDTNDNGVLDAAEVDSTRYVCDGADGADGTNGTGGANPAQVFTTYDGGSVLTSGTGGITVDSITFTASGAGTAYVVASVDAYCGPGDCAPSPPTDGYLTLSNSASATSSSGAYSYFFLEDDRTENLTRSAVFAVAASGSRTYYLRGSASAGTIGFYRPQITVIFFPN